MTDPVALPDSMSNELSVTTWEWRVMGGHWMESKFCTSGIAGKKWIEECNFGEELSIAWWETGVSFPAEILDLL